MTKKFALLVLFLSIISCKNAETKPQLVQQNRPKSKQSFVRDSVVVNFKNLPYKTLSEYGFFSGDMYKLQPNNNVLPYELNSPLFTDYALKKRFIWMQHGQSASIIKEEEIFNFPNATILIKNFYYSKETYREKQIIETRLLVKTNNEWIAYPYVWNEDQTEANYKVTGKVIRVDFNNPTGEKQTINYVVPNKNQCKNCHNNNNKIAPIGPTPMNINKEIRYAEGDVENQLTKWSKEGYLSNYEDQKEYKKLPKWKNVSENIVDRARAYLDINCAHCHNPKGSANTSGLFLSYQQENSTKLGVFKTPVATGRGSGGFVFDIYPSKASKSIFMFRMSSTEPDIMMPELGRVSVHKEGVDLIRSWIDSMPK